MCLLGGIGDSAVSVECCEVTEGDSVAQCYQHLMGLESLLGQLGHPVSDNEVITKFIDGLSDSLRNRLVQRRIENHSLKRQALVNSAVAFETGDR